MHWLFYALIFKTYDSKLPRSVPVHNFIDFQKTFNSVWLAGLWQVLISFETEEGLVKAIQALYEKSNNAVLLNS